MTWSRKIYVADRWPFQKPEAGSFLEEMKQKLALAVPWFHRPSVLFLDEPTTGVDTSFPKGNLRIMLESAESTGMDDFGFRLPYMDEADIVSECLDPREEKIHLSNRYARSHYQVLSGAAFRSEIIKNECAALEFTEARSWPKVALLWGVASPHIQRKIHR